MFGALKRLLGGAVHAEVDGLSRLLHPQGKPRGHPAAPATLSLNALQNFHPGFQLEGGDLQIPTRAPSTKSNILQGIDTWNGAPMRRVPPVQWNVYRDRPTLPPTSNHLFQLPRIDFNPSRPPAPPRRYFY